MPGRLRATWAALLAGTFLAPALARAGGDEVSVVYRTTLGPVVESLAPAFAEKTGTTIVGRAVDSLDERSAIDGGLAADVVLTTDPDVLARDAAAPVVFATDAMVIAYAAGGSFAAATKADTPWFEALEEKPLLFGRPDPDDDDLGLRALFVLQLASRHYDAPDLVLRLLRPGQTMPTAVLVQRLRQSSLDAALLPRSVAIEAGLPVFDLPIEINLGDPGRAAAYAEARVDLDGEVHRGTPILLAAAPLAHGPQARSTRDLLDFLTSPQARELLSARGFGIPLGRPTRRDVATDVDPPLGGNADVIR